MKLPPFALDRWIDPLLHGDPPIQYDLGSSTGPSWSLDDLLQLDPSGDLARQLAQMPQIYAPAQGGELLRNAIAGFHGALPRHVQVTTGASEAINAVYCLLSEPGANVVLPHPVFSSFEALGVAWGFEIRRYEMAPEDHFGVTPDQVLAQVDARTKLVVVNTPHNPTGAVMDLETLGAIASVLTSRGIPVLADEVYHGLYHTNTQRSAATLDGDVIVIGSASKALSLSGLRVGWVIDRDDQRRDRLVDIRSYFSISNTAAGEHLCAFALTHADTVIGRARDVTRTNLAQLERFFDAHAGILSWVHPAGATVAFPKFEGGTDARRFCTECASAGVLLIPGDCFGWPSHFRLGYGAETTRFASGLERAADVLANPAFSMRRR